MKIAAIDNEFWKKRGICDEVRQGDRSMKMPAAIALSESDMRRFLEERRNGDR